MDAQNAVDAASRKPPASPEKAPAEHTKSTGNHTPKGPLSQKAPAEFNSSPPVRDSKANSHDDDGGADANSEAETIVLPGKDGQHSPSKTRKLIKHEAKSDTEESAATTIPPRKSHSVSKEPCEADKPSSKNAQSKDSAASDTSILKKKRPHGASDTPRSKGDANSNGLGSVSNSPPPASSSSVRPQLLQQPRRRRLSTAQSAPSDSESMRGHSPKPTVSHKDRPNPADKLLGHKRKAPKAESEDEAETHKARRQRTGTMDKDNGHTRRLDREQSAGNHNSNHGAVKSARPHQDNYSNSRVRSVSPASRAHRRSISTQLPGQSSMGPSHKKKRIPAPLQPTEYHSDDSSPAGSPRFRGSKLRRLATPAAAEVAISPAKAHHRKGHLDAHGQTQLARACAKGDYESTKQRLKERPEDLNVADFAGNTPLQIASLNGFDSIVKLLIDAGCQLDCVNNDKDTPLLDAVENRHAKVVKLLLEAGLNPRKANLNGEEPLDLVDDDDEETRRLLVEARQKMGERRRASEEHQPRQTDGRDSHGPESPRHSPATTIPPGASAGRRTGTVRANKTSNHLLYMPMDEKTLRQAAGRGDEETVMRILQVRVPSDDPEAMVAAARGGHDIIMNLLLALGNCNPDPAPVSSMSPDSATPMLAAIGQENIAVVELLLGQAGKFDPTRRFKGETYFEIAKRRQGPHWEDEYRILKKAYDEHRKSHKDSARSMGRDLEKEQKRAAQLDSKDEQTSKIHKRKMSSPPGEPKKTATSKLPTSPKEKRRLESAATHRDREDPLSPKRGPGRPRKEDRLPTISVNDRDSSPAISKHTAKPKRAEPDNAAISSEGEAVKPRRKLVSGKDLKGEREKQRRASMASTASSLKEPSSPRDRDDITDKPRSEKFVDRAKQLKRDESRDRLSVSSEGSAKRHRSSATPPRASSDKDGGDGPAKRRKLDVEGLKEKKKAASSEDRPNKGTMSKDSSVKIRRDHDNEDRRESMKSKKSDPKPDPITTDRERKDSIKNQPASLEKNVVVKNEDTDVEMRDVGSIIPPATAPPISEKTEGKAKTQAEIEAEEEAEARRLEEEEDMRIAEEEKRKQREERERRGREEEQKRKREAEEAEKRRKAEQEEQERKRKEEEERKRKAEEERKRREAEAEELRKRKEEEERRRKEEEERKRKAEEEAKRIREAEEARQRAEEEERRKREEEERLRKEQLEREAAEAARKKREEEEERKEQERLREAERRRAIREAEARRLFLEAEAVRLGKLPPLLRWLDTCSQPKATEIAQKFSMMQGVRYDCICPEATGKPEGREQWLLNTQVALLLGEKDLELSRYTAWERVPVSRIAKIVIWRVEADRYSLTSPNLYDLGKRLPSYYGKENLDKLSYKTIEKLRNEARQKFLDMDLFFVKASDLMFIIPTIPHLRNVKLSMAYRELPEDESLKLQPLHKWKTDPDANRNHGFAPGNKYYMNGALVHEKTAGLSTISKTPFPENRTPRRGLVAVTPDDPEYAKMCMEQGLGHLVNGHSGSASPGMINGTSPSPRTIVRRPSTSQAQTNGIEPQPTSPIINGTGRHRLPSGAPPHNPTTTTAPAANPVNGTTTEADKKGLPLVVNGINGITTTNGESTPGDATT
ncbi:uncharacterized protein PgNI_03151 [Pyricularia grisea]|uniref:Ankyrin repeat protein n=1 Tax=Pyricularia grisea TaxID=148305 RepID=A0A6P8B9V6_PYRGI|nr:uncharacterized protein PgNI_03151 [Pyricularia grisea]TLD12600.1 hypothetical protein PgNI_03151 [Pyricularia grisea]